jgi:hypothetical protein
MLTAKEIKWLLEDLCVQHGICLYPDQVEEFLAPCPEDAATFTEAVFVAEGLDPNAHRRLYERVFNLVEAAFSRSEKRQCDELAERMRAIAAELEALLHLPLSTPADLDSWYVSARRFNERLKTYPNDVLRRLPHDLWHYLDDADIRLRTPQYAEAQNERVLAWITALWEGRDPE